MHQIQEEIGIPKIRIQKVSDNHAVFTVSPLPTGYGMTVGNSFRRVLLSSLPGAAVTCVRIEGVTYEYATIKGVKESVLDILLNFKLLQLKKTSKEPTIAVLKADKEGVVRAKDIDVPSDVEILNPDLYITTLDKGGKLHMEIRIEKGVGYRPVAQMEKSEDTTANLLLVDAFFSPVKKVRYDVESTRVGSLTSLDKLTLEIETNGAISPEDSLKFASNVLKSYFGLFNAADVAVEPEFMTDVNKITAKAKEEESKKPTQEAYTPIEILGLSPRTLNALINGEIGSIEMLTKCSESKLTNLRGFGKKALTEVENALATRNLKLSDN
ncbi:MAG: DNA-directed RNA polymerase subunit alpha [Candidatus Peregrinibacteria bacterium GW2011_GWA2_47_7]|nr:MAG: DNA-directed RNA polymerase subunit alpha [Candidatus Peregrinibacteria bacterium GW2011_GWA2_47_7]